MVTIGINTLVYGVFIIGMVIAMWIGFLHQKVKREVRGAVVGSFRSHLNTRETIICDVAVNLPDCMFVVPRATSDIKIKYPELSSVGGYFVNKDTIDRRLYPELSFLPFIQQPVQAAYFVMGISQAVMPYIAATDMKAAMTTLSALYPEQIKADSEEDAIVTKPEIQPEPKMWLDSNATAKIADYRGLSLAEGFIKSLNELTQKFKDLVKGKLSPTTIYVLLGIVIIGILGLAYLGYTTMKDLAALRAVWG